MDSANIDCTAEDINRCVTDNTFANARKRAVDAVEASEGGDAQQVFFKGGVKSFFFKGSNGRWVDVLTPEDLELYEDAKQRVLSPDCAQWLEDGTLG